MTPATVFLSYSHKDEKEKDALLSHLRVLEHAGLSIDLWNDDRIGAGGDWEREINEAMERASVAILLISHNFLTSPFILKKEVRPLLERRADEGLTVFPIIAKACAWKRVPWLTKMNLRPKNGTPVWQGEALDLDEKLAAITEEVADIVDKKEAERQEAIRCHLNDAQGARENGDYSEAYRFLDAILGDKGLDPGNEEAGRLRNEVKREEKLSIEAARQEAIRCHLNDAQTALENNDYSEAYRFLDAILGDKGLDPGNEEAGRLRNAVEREDQLSTLHKSLARARSPARIVEISGQILKLAPDDKEVQTAHEQARHQLEIDECRKDAEAAFEKGDYEGAIASWKRLLALELADKEAEEAKAELERTYNQGITRLTKTLKEREEETESLKGTVQVREEQIEKLKNQIRELQAAREKDAAQIQAQTQQINVLETELDLLKNPPRPKLPRGLVYRDEQIFCEKDDAEMVLIPAGKFQMGSNDGDKDEKPVHPVFLDAFYMDVHPVTNAQYRKFIDARGHGEPDYWTDTKYNQPNAPVVGVTWEDAVEYCKWAGKRLPTETEWEYAARGSLVGKRYPWGDAPLDEGKANYGKKVGKPTAVKNYDANDYGLYDMMGNVWEWCADWYGEGYYKDSPAENPQGPTSGNYRVLRGGSWYNDASRLGCAVRYFNLPVSRSNYFGFRGVQSASP